MTHLTFFRYDTANDWGSCCWETGTGQEGATLVGLSQTGGQLKRGIAGIGSRPHWKTAERSRCITVLSLPPSPTEQNQMDNATGGRRTGRYDQPNAGAGNHWLGTRENHGKKTGVQSTGDVTVAPTRAQLIVLKQPQYSRQECTGRIRSAKEPRKCGSR